MRGFSEGKSDAGKHAPAFGFALDRNYFYTMLCGVLAFFSVCF
jgi:hypothetical protein